MDAPLTIDGVSVHYGEGAHEVWALRDVSLSVRANELVAITGRSGSGKTTLLNVAAGLLRPSSGRVLVNGRTVHDMKDRERSRMRRRDVAYIYQFFNLLPTLTAKENVALPLLADGIKRREVEERTGWALDLVGMAQRAGHYPDQLSGGEMQRVAIARALATRARILLADEPTGNLDSVRGEEILEMLKRVTEKEGRSVVLVTHDSRAAAYGDRVIVLRDGRIADEVETGTGRAEILPFVR